VTVNAFGTATSAGLKIVTTLVVILGWCAAAQAQDDKCVECHEEVPLTSPAHPELSCADCHGEVTARHRRKGLEPFDDEVCSDCHRRPGREVGRSVHDGEAGCLDCHGAPHELSGVEDLQSAISAVNQIQSCGGCHDEPAGLVDGYVSSVHGLGLLRSGLSNSASCSDCHGAHKVSSVSDESSPTTHAHAPDMCGQCHGLLLDDWKNSSAHGQAWLEDNAEAPVCTDCHSSHGVDDPTSVEEKLASAGMCGECHTEYLLTFRGTFHGKASNLGFEQGATCADCHTPHKNLSADDPRSSVHPDNVAETCGSCHEGVSDSILSFEPHNDPSNPDDNFYVYVVWLFMTSLLIGVFSFFILHDSLWLQRTIVGALRGEFEQPDSESGQYVRRFVGMYRFIHVTIIVTFLTLALTGLPLKFNDTAWGQQLMSLLGGVESSTFLHRIAAIGTFGYALFHLGNVFYRWAIKRERGMFWGPNSMVPQPKDVSDVWRNFRYFLYLGKRPASDRWNYIEKFDYLAVFWGVMIIGLSGLMLWLPMLFMKFLPGWTINVAYVVHSDEALLAMGFIFVFHFFHTHLRPESFPMDISIFTGKLSLERFKEERPLEYQRLVANDELDEYLVEPPNEREIRRAHIWGTIFVTTGLLLAVGIFWALVTH
jgi:cytochrome b subunit of formate dehydrogenase